MDVDTTAEAEFAPVLESARTARRHVVAVLDRWGVDSHVAELLVSELATNAIIHAGTAFRVTLHRLERSVRVAVVDSGGGLARPNRYSLTAGTGRGLAMVEDLSLAWGSDDAPTGKCVWFEVPAPAQTRGPRTDDAPPTDRSDLAPPITRLGGNSGSAGSSDRLCARIAA